MSKTLDDRSFEEQMRDLNVKIVKQKPEKLKNITWLRSRGRASPLVDKISVNKSIIGIGSKVYQMLADEKGGKKLQFAVAEYRDQKVLVIEVDAAGYKLTQLKSGYIKVGSLALIKKIQSHGLPLGIYKVKKAKGGIICIPEGEQL